MSEADDEVEVSLFSSQSWPVLALFAVSIAVWIYIVYLIAKKVLRTTQNAIDWVKEWWEVRTRIRQSEGCGIS